MAWAKNGIDFLRKHCFDEDGRMFFMVTREGRPLRKRRYVFSEAFAIAALAMIGMPPTAVFVSKWYILSGAVDAGQMLAVAVLLLSTLLTAGYLLPVVYTAFFETPGKPDNETHGEAPPAILLALGVTTLGTLMLFFFPDLLLAFANQLTGSGT